MSPPTSGSTAEERSSYVLENVCVATVDEPDAPEDAEVELGEVAPVFAAS